MALHRYQGCVRGVGTPEGTSRYATARRWAIFSLTFFVVTVASGCKDHRASEDALPHGHASPALSLQGKPTAPCFAMPLWATSKTDTHPSYVVELIHQAVVKKREKSHGTGFRLRNDHVLETYDDIVLSKSDKGRPVLKRVQGKWSVRGVVSEASYRSVLKQAQAWSKGTSRSGAIATDAAGGYRTWLRVNAGSPRLVCYQGTSAPKTLASLQARIENLVKDVSSPSPSTSDATGRK